MSTPDVRRELERGSSLILGTVSTELRPRAARAWGIRLCDGEPLTVRLMVEGSDTETLANLAPGRHLAVTCAAIDSLVSVQLKCRSLGLEEPDDADRANSLRQRAGFLDDIARVDGLLREWLESWGRFGEVVCVAEVLQVFDQTPGPAAGGLVGM